MILVVGEWVVRDTVSGGSKIGGGGRGAENLFEDENENEDEDEGSGQDAPGSDRANVFKLNFAGDLLS